MKQFSLQHDHAQRRNDYDAVKTFAFDSLIVKKTANDIIRKMHFFYSRNCDRLAIITQCLRVLHYHSFPAEIPTRVRKIRRTETNVRNGCQCCISLRNQSLCN